MLELHLDYTQPRAVPYTDGRYYVRDGTTLVNSTTEDIVISDSDGNVEITICNCIKKVALAWVIALTFKPLFRAQEFFLDWFIQYADGDRFNLVPENLIWTPPVGGTECPEMPGYYVIPGATRNAVSKCGKLISRAYMKRPGLDSAVEVCEIKTRYSTRDGYMRCGIFQDIGRKATSTVHRLMGYALLPYESNVRQMTINHKDGIKHHNEIDNLEWVTYSENNIHAMDIGLSDCRMPVKYYDYVTGESRVYSSLSQCAEACKINSGHLFELVRTNGARLLHRRIGFKFADSQQPFVQRDRADTIAAHAAWLNMREHRKCYAIDLKTGHKYIADNPSLLAGLLQLTRHQVETFIESDSKFPHFGHTFGWLNEFREPPVFEPDELEAFIPFATVSIAYRAYLPDGSTRVLVGRKSLDEIWPDQDPTYMSKKLLTEGAVYVRDDIRVVRL